ESVRKSPFALLIAKRAQIFFSLSIVKSCVIPFPLNTPFSYHSTSHKGSPLGPKRHASSTTSKCCEFLPGAVYATVPVGPFIPIIPLPLGSKGHPLLLSTCISITLVVSYNKI